MSAAYPHTRHCSERGEEWQETESGLTKRELIAAMAMQALITKHPAVEVMGAARNVAPRATALGAVDYADALLAALARLSGAPQL